MKSQIEYIIIYNKNEYILESDKIITSNSKSIKYTYDINIPLDQHVTTLCESLQVPGLYKYYGLVKIKMKRKGTKRVIKKISRFDGKKRIKPGLILLLSLDLKEVKRNPILLDIYTRLYELSHGKDKNVVKVAFELSKKMMDKEYCEEFRSQNGVQSLIGKILIVEGNALAYSLKALDRYIRVLGNFQFMKTGLLERLLECLFNSSLSVSRTAASILSQLASPNAHQGAAIFLARRRDSLNWKEIVSLFAQPDIPLQVAVLSFINNMIESQTDKEKLSGQFYGTLQRRGILKSLSMAIDTEDLPLRKEISIFQFNHLNWLIREKSIDFDPDNIEHVGLLKRLWKISFPDEEFGGIDHSNWRLLGFQNNQPAKDLRGTGLLGLRHIIFYAEQSSECFLRRKHEFMFALENLSPEYQLPLCTMAINVTRLLIQELFHVKQLQFTEDDITSISIYSILLFPNGLINLFSILVEYVCCLWKRDNCTNLEFSNLLNAVMKDTIDLLNYYANSFITIEQLRSKLLNSIDSFLQVHTPDFDEILFFGDGEKLFDVSNVSRVPQSRGVSELFLSDKEKSKKKKHYKIELSKSSRKKSSTPRNRSRSTAPTVTFSAKTITETDSAENPEEGTESLSINTTDLELLDYEHKEEGGVTFLRPRKNSRKISTARMTTNLRSLISPFPSIQLILDPEMATQSTPRSIEDFDLDSLQSFQQDASSDTDEDYLDISDQLCENRTSFTSDSFHETSDSRVGHRSSLTSDSSPRTIQ